jgi:DNA-binding CsgD family transcriptional regulator
MKLLSPRQAQVYALLVAGMTAAQISAELGIKVSTVKTHIEKLYRKSGVRSRQELAQANVDEADLNIKLTRKQVQVLNSLLVGKTNPQIAQEMGISPIALQIHRRNLYKKMGVATRPQLLALMARRQADA